MPLFPATFMTGLWEPQETGHWLVSCLNTEHYKRKLITHDVAKFRTSKKPPCKVNEGMLCEVRGRLFGICLPQCKLKAVIDIVRVG